MTEKLKNIVQEEVMKLPKEAQEAIASLDWGNIVEEIGKKYLLDESEINDLQAETLTVLLGLTDLELYAIDIENEIGTTKDNANKIAAEVIEKIFAPIGNKIIENIKKSGKHNGADAEKNLNFILSGGDWTAFVEIPPPLDKGRTEEGSLIPPPSGEDRGGVANSPHLFKPEGLSEPERPDPLLKGEGGYPPRPDFGRGTPQEGNKPRKMEDLRSKFTI